MSDTPRSDFVEFRADRISTDDIDAVWDCLDDAINLSRKMEREITSIRLALTARYGELGLENILDEAMRIYERHAKD